MAADIQALAANYRLRAEIQHKGDLKKQRDYLADRYIALDNEGPAEATQVSGTGGGGSVGWQYRGATIDEQMTALAMVIKALDEEIAATDAGGTAPGPIGAIEAIFRHAPH